MKRHASPGSLHDERQTTRRRQDPVSCQSCRKKKLKCSRTFPCSNCVSRCITCEPPDAKQLTEDKEGVRSSPTAVTSDSTVLARVLERLERLEHVVLTKKSSYTSPVSSVDPDKHYFTPGAGAHEDEAQNTAFHELGGNRFVNFRSTVLDEPNNFQFFIRPVSKLISDLDTNCPTHTGPILVGSKIIRRICLPERHEANVLLKSYFESLGSWYHIYHKRTVISLMESFYLVLAGNEQPRLADAALLMSIFASGAGFLVFARENIVNCSEYSSQVIKYWTQGTLDILNKLGRSTSDTSLEQIQATIIISLVIQNYEGCSKNYYLLHSASLAHARDMGLHVLDHPSRIKERGNVVVAEVKRRVWWYIAGTDWLHSSMPGSHEGTYSIQPQHCLVKYMANVDDALLVPGAEIPTTLMSEPSEMSYFIVRVRGAELCRPFGDMVYPLALGVNNVNYDDIIALEKNISEFVENNMPFYFRLDEESRKRTEPYLQKYPQLATQRYMLQQGLHSHRSRIHRPFLIRGTMDTRYSFSRRACLESVRKSLEIRRLLDHEKPDNVLPVARLNFVVYHVFTAALTLALDLCFHKSATVAEDQNRRAELQEACKMLKDARKELPTSDRYLDPLLKLLRKHKIQLQDAGTQDALTGTSTVPQSIAQPAQQTTPSCSRKSEFTHELNQSEQIVMPDLDFDLDSLWQDFTEMVPDANSQEWSNLFADIDQQMATGPSQ